MYLNRLFFRRDTGILITQNYMNDGGTGGFSGEVPSIDEDFEALRDLQQYVTDKVEVIEIAENDTDTQNKLNTCTSVNLDIATNKLVFSFTTPQASLEQVKQAKYTELSQACQNAITGGFTSTSYQNVNKTYNSTLEDQANITGNALSAVSKVAGVQECQQDKFYYHARGEDFVEWTANECLQLARDFKTFKEQQLIKNKQLQVYVNALTSVEEVQKVTWDTVIPTQK